MAEVTPFWDQSGGGNNDEGPWNLTLPHDGGYGNHTQHLNASVFIDPFGDVLYGLVVPVLYSAVTLTGLLGNALVIYIICTDQKMRTITNLLLLNLAIADLAFVLIVPPFTAYETATTSWPFSGRLGDILCKLMHYLINVTAYVTIYTLVVIAIMRYMTIMHNAATVKYRTTRVVSFVIGALWLLMLAVNAPILLVYGAQLNPYYGITECEYYGRDIGQLIFLTFFLLAYVIPLSVIAALSLRILVHINGVHGRSAHQTSLLRGSDSHARSLHRKRRASRLLVVVVVVFAIFWFPFNVHIVVVHFIDQSLVEKMGTSDMYRVAHVLFNFLAYINSCVNPVIYNYTCEEFRRHFRRILCCRAPPAEDATTSGGGGGGGGGMQLVGLGEGEEPQMVSVGNQCNGHSPVRTTEVA